MLRVEGRSQRGVRKALQVATVISLWFCVWLTFDSLSPMWLILTKPSFFSESDVKSMKMARTGDKPYVRIVSCWYRFEQKKQKKHPGPSLHTPNQWFPEVTWSAGQHCLVGRGRKDCFFHFWRQCQQIVNNMLIIFPFEEVSEIWRRLSMWRYLNDVTGFSQRKPHPIISRLHWQAHPRLYKVKYIMNFLQILKHNNKTHWRWGDVSVFRVTFFVSLIVKVEMHSKQ